MNQPDITTLSKSGLLSEINALNFKSDWSAADIKYSNQLESEYYKRIHDECEVLK